VINFRYHVVSLTAVFLALAVGLVLGTAALNGTLTDNLHDQVSSLSKSNEQLRGDLKHADQAANAKEQFEQQMAPKILAGTLTDRRVLVVTLPDADSKQVSGVIEKLGYAGAKVTGQIQLTSTFIDPAHADALGDLASHGLPSDIKGLPKTSDGVAVSAALLAQVLLDKGSVSTLSRGIVISAYATDEDLVETTKVTGPAEAVVIVAGPPSTDKDAAKRNAALLTTVKEFGRAAPTVVAGEGTSGDGNVLAAVRGDSTLTKQVSTVDTLNVVEGQIVTAQALAPEIAGKSGQYGTGDGAQALMPKDDS
jgi:hypothetical protein